MVGLAILVYRVSENTITNKCASLILFYIIFITIKENTC